ncbi:HAD family hydrolase [Leptolyngbya sp. NIES-2104]|uniref:HAD family hydrolase n=1 Tax=Leptolyngbya sp. NIES-2104 TaxID=1552121 RepID=UPI0006EC4CDB|nr:haloacid dehalogenase [Leptolyngbya sp. NIES-2104]GAP96420.1 HAD superfamily hydrolase [Leptolyngbya sp. NIES-2104]
MSVTPRVLALDFDGVVCDGLKEYFQTAWKAYAQIWQAEATPDEKFAPAFYRLRPVVETGWEMPVLIRAIVTGIEEKRIFQNWTAIATQIVSEDHLKPLEISAIVDTIRDQQIATDLESWLVEHEFYPGVLDRLRSILTSSTDFFIISTKEGRFIKQLLQKQGIELKDEQVYGKESKRPKPQVLAELKETFGETASIWFVEDRLKTLQTIEKQETLANVELFLADWGYNTELERLEGEKSDRIHLLSLAQFAQDFSNWI